MAGRDAYLGIGFDESVNPLKLESKPPQPNLPRQTFAAGQSVTPASNIAADFDDAAPAQRGEYFAGLLVVLIVLVIGFIFGFIGRGWINLNPSPDSAISVLGTQPVPAFENLASNANSDIVFVGSNASDQVLAVEALENGDALLLVKSHFGANSDEVGSRLLRFSASEHAGEGHDVKELRSFKGEASHLERIGNGDFVVTTLSDGMLTVSGLKESGRIAWTQVFTSTALNGEEIALATHQDGIVVMAPGESRALARLVSIGFKGKILWDQSLDRPGQWQEPFVGVDPLGQTFAVLGTESNTQDIRDKNIVMINQQGRVLRQRLLMMSSQDVIAGMAARPAGGMTFLVSGDAPRLVQLDEVGLRVATADLPYMQYLSDVQMASIEAGDLLIASTFALMGNRVDLVLEQRDSVGASLGQRTLSLPTGASLEAFTEVSENEYLITGSVRRDRYAPTDLYVQRVAFLPTKADFEPPISPAPVSDEMALPAGTQPTAESGEVTLSGLSSEQAESRPLIASLIVVDEIAPAESDAQPEAGNIDPLMSASPVAPEPVSAESDGPSSVVTAAETTEIGEESLSVEFLGDENAAALSRFLDQSVITQCRFSCLDGETGNAFPMTGHFLVSTLSNADGTNAMHSRLCEAAGLQPELQTRPVCGIGQ